MVVQRRQVGGRRGVRRRRRDVGRRELCGVDRMRLVRAVAQHVDVAALLGWDFRHWRWNKSRHNLIGHLHFHGFMMH